MIERGNRLAERLEVEGWKLQVGRLEVEGLDNGGRR